MNPSDFKKYPWSSVLQNSESETIAMNIIKILSRTGDTWRRLTWEEYQYERMKDAEAGQQRCAFSERERLYFEEVLPYTVSESAARDFCETWALVGRDKAEGK